MLPMTVASVTSAQSFSFLMVVSSRSRSSASPRPSSRPRTTPSARLRVGLGLTGVVGTVGELTTVTLTGLDWPLLTLSRSVTVLENCLPTASATCAATRGLVFCTATWIRTVLSGTVAVIWFPRLVASVFRCSVLITGSSTLGVVMTLA